MPAHRPLLLPQNRRLRHLCGIYLRNLSFNRPRGRTIDDAALNKSPTKLDTLRETSQLHHSHSSESLKAAPRPRRRSTTLASASTITRQKKLEYVVESRVADVFFSLHCDVVEGPIYISEIGRRATNFNFQSFELSNLGPAITRSSLVTVKIWAARHQTYSLLLEDDVDLRFLSFIGTLQNLHMPPNCVIFHLVDGIYVYDVTSKAIPPKQGPALATSSYNSLMRLSTLDTSIQDALATQEKLSLQIDDLLASHKHVSVEAQQDKVLLVKRHVSQQQRTIAATRKKRDELQTSLRARQAAIKLGRELQEQASGDVENAMEQLAASRTILSQTKDNIRGQRRRICEDLIRIFPITDAPSGQPLSFQICSVPLPNTVYDPTLTSRNAGEDALSAGLGYVAQLTNALQSYLGVALPYPIKPFGSRSSIRDDISMLPDPQREFPLYVPRGGSSAQYRFDYGWFLLNKDIEMLCMSQGIRVVDIRHTLPNLKYLLFVCSAGKEELPERKKGGIRGLWQGRLRSRGGGVGGQISFSDDFCGSSSASGSRRGSAESEVSHPHPHPAREELKMTTSTFGRGMKMKRDSSQGRVSGRIGGSELSPSFSPPPTHLSCAEEPAVLTLRTKGLREDVIK